MIYLLYGTKEYNIKEEIKKISKNIDKINISRYNLENDLLKDALDDCETYSLFGDKKLVIIENANMFASGNNKDTELLEKYINNYNPNTILILIVQKEKIDSRKKITSLIKSKGKVMEFNDEKDPKIIIKNMLKDYQIEDINLLIDRVGSNPLILKNEIEKIILYKGDDKKITKEDIINLSYKNIDIDIFKLIDYIIKGNKEKAIEMYHEMIKVNEEPLKIVIMLANQFRIMYQSKELFFKGYSEKDIASTLKIHPYRVKLAIQNSRNYSKETLLKYLYNLAIIDIDIKTGKINKDLALELFILK